MASKSLFPKAVLPIVATFTVAYPSMFFLGLWHEARQDGELPRGRTIAHGALNGGWRYDVSHRAFPGRSYRVDVTPERPGARPICVVEVQGGPRPERAMKGAGPVVHVTFEEPLKGQQTRSLTINLAEALDSPCAALVEDGVRIPPDAAGDHWLTIVRHGRADVARGG